MLTEQQLTALTVLFRHGADDASDALSKWLGKHSEITIEQIEEIPLAEATNVLGDPDAPACACSMGLRGRFTGQLVMVFDDPSGFALADVLLNQPVGTSTGWGEVEQSAALETANIIGCAYLNALARSFRTGNEQEMLPTPPRFVRDYAASLMQFILMDQAMASDHVFLTRTEFRIEGEQVGWSLLFVPDAQSASALREVLKW